jgi:enterochelin esterase-like enzyme
MKKISFFLAICAVGILSVCCAQQDREFRSVICNADGTVTFRYKNPFAKDVQVDVQFAGKNPMTKVSDDVWEVTLGPAAPDMYPYNFVVDGVSIMDPYCPQYFPNEGFKNSLLEIPAADGQSLPHDIKDVPHGKVEYIHYYSQSLKATNHAIVYLPPTYNPQNIDKKYPVFYLISGTTDTEEVYYKVGRMNYILDNLLAEGKAKEMIIVLPYGNPTKLLYNAPQNPMFMGDVFSNDLINDLMPYIERNYLTINDRNHRAIGGFSRGGNQGLSNGLNNLDKFSYLCSYSSFTSTNIPDVYDNADDTNQKINLFWLGIGTDDFLYGTSRDYLEFLDQKGIRTAKVYTDDKFGHTWMNAKYFLDITLRLLFNPEASAEAMENSEPTLAATGKEEPFTPGVMARLFPRPIISPEYGTDSITFRFKTPEANEVWLALENGDKKLMTKEEDGVWSISIGQYTYDTFKYCFVVDGTMVADPSNMYLSPDKGFKYSIANHPAAPYNFASMGDIAHGKVSYNLNNNTATYFPPVCEEAPILIKLELGDNDTMESWFKVGGADAIADKLIADGKASPCVITTDSEWAESENQETHVLKASDYSTWNERRKALEDLLTKTK